MESLDRQIIQFVDSCVDTAFELLPKQPGKYVALGGFDATLRERASERAAISLGITSEKMAYLLHPFHWALFKENSPPFNLFFPTSYSVHPKSEWLIEVGKEGLDGARERIKEYIAKTYLPLLRANIVLPNTLPQSA